jgi:hypothetical protein
MRYDVERWLWACVYVDADANERENVDGLPPAIAIAGAAALFCLLTTRN